MGDEGSIQVFGPGPHDVLGFERDTERAGTKGGVRHFGIRLKAPADTDATVEEVEPVGGGKLLKPGEFKPGFPFAYVADPDGYKSEIWYE